LILGGIGVAVAVGAGERLDAPRAVCGAGIACGKLLPYKEDPGEGVRGRRAVNKGFVVQYTVKFRR